MRGPCSASYRVTPDATDPTPSPPHTFSATLPVSSDERLSIVTEPDPAGVVTTSATRSPVTRESLWVVSSNSPVAPAPMLSAWFPSAPFTRALTVTVPPQVFAFTVA